MGIFGDSEDRAARKAKRGEMKPFLEGEKAKFRELESELASLREDREDLIEAGKTANLTKWEYKFAYNIDELTAREFGEAGWELVAAFSYTTGGGIGVEVYSVKFRTIFKRPLSTGVSSETEAVDTEIDQLVGDVQIQRDFYNKLAADYRAEGGWALDV